ncbi:MAG TPA: nucleotide exchange factor GrpE [Acidimicrobiia bacterium]|nr:nucleotide exchange factor GrpE [Acidimicrobiia bacterium]
MNDTGTEKPDRVVEALPVEKADQTPDPHSLGLELPDEPEEAIKLLLVELAEAREEATSYLDDLKRVAADFDNYRKRTTRDGAAMFDRATEKVVRSLMPVLDTFDAALNAEPKTETEKQLYSGMLNTREQLLDALKSEGLEVIPTIDEPFDPEVHEPVGAPDGNGELMVTQELRRGYRLGGKVLRAALVAVETSP